MKPGPAMSTRTGLKIVAAVALSLLGMALLPVLALPYSSLDWLAYDPAYQQGHSFPSTARLPAESTPEIPCAEQPGPDEPLAARVNKQGIAMKAFEREMAQFLAALETAGADRQGEKIQAEMPEYRRQVLDHLIDDALVQQAAVELGLAIPDQEIQIRVSEEVSQSGGLDWFEGWLQETGQTWEEYEQDICQDMLRQAVLDQVTAEITGTVEIGQDLTPDGREALRAAAFQQWLAERREAAQIEIWIDLDSPTR
jgi:hypothetical protein